MTDVGSRRAGWRVCAWTPLAPHSALFPESFDSQVSCLCSTWPNSVFSPISSSLPQTSLDRYEGGGRRSLALTLKPLSPPALQPGTWWFSRICPPSSSPCSACVHAHHSSPTLGLTLLQAVPQSPPESHGMCSHRPLPTPPYLSHVVGTPGLVTFHDPGAGCTGPGGPCVHMRCACGVQPQYVGMGLWDNSMSAPQDDLGLPG